MANDVGAPMFGETFWQRWFIRRRLFPVSNETFTAGYVTAWCKSARPRHQIEAYIARAAVMKAIQDARLSFSALLGGGKTTLEDRDLCKKSLARWVLIFFSRVS